MGWKLAELTMRPLDGDQRVVVATLSSVSTADRIRPDHLAHCPVHLGHHPKRDRVLQRDVESGSSERCPPADGAAGRRSRSGRGQAWPSRASRRRAAGSLRGPRWIRQPPDRQDAGPSRRGRQPTRPRPMATPLAEMSPRASLGPSWTDRSRPSPGRSEASMTSPPCSTCPTPIAANPMIAIWPRSPAPTDEVSATTGWIPALSIATRVSPTAGGDTGAAGGDPHHPGEHGGTDDRRRQGLPDRPRMDEQSHLLRGDDAVGVDRRVTVVPDATGQTVDRLTRLAASPPRHGDLRRCAPAPRAEPDLGAAGNGDHVVNRERRLVDYDFGVHRHRAYVSADL